MYIYIYRERERIRKKIQKKRARKKCRKDLSYLDARRCVTNRETWIEKDVTVENEEFVRRKCAFMIRSKEKDTKKGKKRQMKNEKP